MNEEIIESVSLQNILEDSNIQNGIWFLSISQIHFGAA